MLNIYAAFLFSKTLPSQPVVVHAFAIGRAVNTATFVGAQPEGSGGGVRPGFPCLVIIQRRLPPELCRATRGGARLQRVVRILSSVLKLGKSTVVDGPTAGVFAVVLVLAVLGSFVSFPAGWVGSVLSFLCSPVVLVVAAGVAGLCIRAAREGCGRDLPSALLLSFFKAGLFAIGGGLATIPFLTDIGQRTGWFTSGELANMIAISESTPGPMGVNMATYVGFHTGGIAGGVIATLGLVCPSILVILVIAGFLKKFRESRGVDAVFYGIRPASTALIAAALAEVCSIALLNLSAFQTGGAAALFQWKGIALAVVIFVCLQVKPLKKLHPIVFIAASAVIGAVFQF